MNKNTFVVFIAILALLAIPTIIYGVNTGFVLVDDMFCWTLVDTGLWKWFSFNFLSFDSSRFRPTWELHEIIAWNAFGASSFLHHLLRFVFKGGIVFFIYRILGLFFEKNPPAHRLSFFVLVAFYFFFPNNPESRLAPQEIILIFFYLGLSYYVLKATLAYDGNIFQNRKLYASSILFAFLLLGSKENSFVFLFAVCIYLVLSHRFSFNYFIKLLPFVFLFLFGLAKAYVIFKSPATYGSQPFSLDLIFTNLEWINDFVFLGITSTLAKYLLYLPILYVSVQIVLDIVRNRRDLFSKRFFEVLGQIIRSKPIYYFFIAFIGTFLITLTAWVPAVRYFYPLMLTLVMLVGIAAGKVYETLNVKLQALYRPTVIVLALFFILVNYYNLLMQFAVQYYNSQTERQVLGRIEELLNDGKAVKIVGKLEHEFHVTRYFNEFRPHFFGKPNPNLQYGVTLADNDSSTYYVSHELVSSVWYSIDSKYIENVYDQTLQKAKEVSSALQRTIEPRVWIDAGADLNSKWSIYRVAENDRKQIVVASDSVVTIGGADPYNEFVVPLPVNVGTNDDFAVELTYKTIGSARPFIVAYGNPFSLDKLVLHDQIPNTGDTPQTVRLRFQKNQNTLLTPHVVFRNWSPGGQFQVISYRVFKSE